MNDGRERFLVISATLKPQIRINSSTRGSFLRSARDWKEKCQAELAAGLNIKKKEQTIAGSSDDENIYDWIVNIPMTTGPCPDCGSAMMKANIRDLCGTVYFRVEPHTLCTIS